MMKKLVISGVAGILILAMSLSLFIVVIMMLLAGGEDKFSAEDYATTDDFIMFSFSGTTGNNATFTIKSEDGTIDETFDIEIKNDKFTITKKVEGDASGKYVTDNGRKIWATLQSKGYSKAATAGIMGNMWRESGFDPSNLENSFESTLGSDEEYTARMQKGLDSNDKSVRESFINDKAGYGICQWTYSSRKEDFWDYVKGSGYKINDLTVQLKFMLYEANNTREYIGSGEFKNMDDPDKAARVYMERFEGPDGQSVEGNIRANYAKEIYEQYKGLSGYNMTIKGEIKDGQVILSGNMDGTPLSGMAELKGTFFSGEGCVGSESFTSAGKPVWGDPYWFSTKYNPFAGSENGLPNCTCYVTGYWAKVLKKNPGLSTRNACTFYGHSDPYARGKTPKIGAIACWSGHDAGHVAIVTGISSEGVTIAESAYNRRTGVWNKENYYNNPRYYRVKVLPRSMEYDCPGYSFQGFIYLPATINSNVSTGNGEVTQ